MDPSAPSDRTRSHLAFLAGAGEMARAMREHDWTRTPLGPPERWPQSLRSALSILIASRAQICLFWGKDLVALYNDAYRPVLGVKHGTALGSPGREVFREIWSDVLEPLLEGVLRTGEAFWASDHPFALERHGFVEETFFDVSYDPVRDETGGVGGVFCIVSETTGRVVGERRLRTLRDLGAVGGESSTTEAAFREAARTLAANARDVPFALLYDVSEGLDRARCVATSGIEAMPADAFGLGEVVHGERTLDARRLALPAAPGTLPHTLPGGPWPEPPREVLLLPLAVAGDAPLGVLVAAASPRLPLDDDYRSFLRLCASRIAEAAGAARALEQQRARAEALAALDRAKSAFFSNVSHEFRTPLTLMLSPLEDLLARSKTGGTERELVAVAHRNGLRLLRMVNALLDVSRLEAGRMQLAMEPVDLAAYTAELASMFRSAMEKAGLDYRIDCPPLGAPVAVDRDAWEKVVLNLLSNALKFTLQGSVAVTLAEADGHAVLTVADTGAGIPAGELDNVFTRFHRVVGTKARTHEGTGIGLSLVQELVKLHGGTVTVASREGEGSTFRVALPLRAAHAAMPAAGAAPTHAAAAARRAGPSRARLHLEEVEHWLPPADAPPPGAAAEADASAAARDSAPATASARAPAGPAAAPTAGHVVLADDNRDMREYVQRLLHEEGYAVTAVADGRAALHACERHVPDLVLSDVMMPEMDGFALLAALRSHPELHDVAVVMLSARAGEEATAEGLDRGADDYLVKPFAAVELKARVRANLEIARLRRATGERERALRLEAEAERDRLRAVLAGIRDRFLVVDREFAVTFVSDSWCATTGLDRDQVRGRAVWELFPELVGTEWESTARRVMTTREPAILDHRYEADGTWWALRFSPMADGGIAQLAVDVTDRRRAEAERLQLLESERAARSEAERAMRVRDEFLATLSHELRTPLNAIVGWTHVLRRVPQDAEGTRRGLEIIERNAQAQNQLIADMLDMSRIISGKMRLEIRRVELPGVIRAAVDSLTPTAEVKGVRLQPVIESITDPVHGDPSRLQQVVWNLLSNAIKFTPRGGRVQVVLARVNSHAEITVSDTGQGLTADFLPHVFERFRQADGGTARQQGGLGIGLALVKEITELHGGRVRAHSPGENQGATFVVELPLAVFADGGDGPREHPRAPALSSDGSAALDLAGLRVLLVDDEPDSLEVVRRLLQECGIAVRCATDAAQALAILAEDAFDVVLSDVGMPGQDGYGFIREARRRGIATPAAVLTAFARREDKTRALLAGYQAHLGKPVAAAELLATLGVLSGRTPPPDRG